MNKKIIIIVILAGIISGRPVYSQEGGGGSEQHQVSLLLGNGMFYMNPTSYMHIAKNADILKNPDVLTKLKLADPNSNSLLNMIGIEYKFHISDQLSASFSGAGYVSNVPWRDAIDGVPLDPNNPSGKNLVPKYETIDAEVLSRFVGNLGAQYYLLGNERVRTYAGAQFTLQLARLKATSTYSGFDEASLESDMLDMGQRSGQTIGVSPSITAGIEYNLAPNLIIGFEFKPFSFYYSGVKLVAQPGLEARTFVSQEFNFLAQPMFKIGFTF